MRCLEQKCDEIKIDIKMKYAFCLWYESGTDTCTVTVGQKNTKHERDLSRLSMYAPVRFSDDCLIVVTYISMLLLVRLIHVERCERRRWIGFCGLGQELPLAERAKGRAC